MPDNFNTITRLLTKNGMSAAQMTSLLKKIGNGSMRKESTYSVYTTSLQSQLLRIPEECKD